MDNLAYIDDIYENELKTELINGKIVMMSPRPKIDHVTVSDNIFFAFRTYLKGKNCRAFSEADVFVDEKNRFIPDAMIVCDSDKIQQDGIHGAPDLVVEVLSRSTAKNDRTIKKYLYAKSGVKEYWIVDTWGKYVEVYYNKSGYFVLDNTYFYYTDDEIAQNDKLADDDRDKVVIYDRIKVSVCDDLFVKLKDIFENI